jgi:hypothetical protein
LNRTPRTVMVATMMPQPMPMASFHGMPRES